ncbi:Uncharacterised protein [Chlamydia trachomatis]|nr:Uncharacterised protein [Chlamydia trachomatis]
MALIVGIKAVEIHHLKQWLAIDGTCGNVIELGACGVAQILNIELEILGLHLIGSKRVDIFHHQVPHGQSWRRGCALQHFHKERLRSAVDVSRKFTHLIGFTTKCVLIRHGQDLIGIECRVEGDIAQRTIERVLRRRQQTRTLNFFIVLSSLNSIGLKRLQCA